MRIGSIIPTTPTILMNPRNWELFFAGFGGAGLAMGLVSVSVGVVVQIWWLAVASIVMTAMMLPLVIAGIRLSRDMPIITRDWRK